MKDSVNRILKTKAVMDLPSSHAHLIIRIVYGAQWMVPALPKRRVAFDMRTPLRRFTTVLAL